MQENEIIGKLYAKISDVFNQMFTLRDEYSNSKLVQKVLQYLHERFDIKAATIEESKDIDMHIGEFIESFQTFKIKLDEVKRSITKENNIALQVTETMPTDQSIAT
ncbi:hypothetical protein J1N35_013837 [Gossypium stocksii]|uniref:Uncharacterized protein n=1 Tax=Gossypium stocksii TaxID=47602 RepID=A0A9D3VVL4_9ROSI|nr:hypothetical protein J1N35_013837 [Gossypium stocksii]